MPEHLSAALAQQVFVIDNEDANPRLGLGGNREQGRDILSLVPSAGSCDAVLCNRDGHGALSRGFQRLIRRVRAMLSRPRSIKELPAKSPFSCWCGLGRARTGAPICIRMGLGIAPI